MRALELIDTWPAHPVAVGVLGPDDRVYCRGPATWQVRLASVTKLLSTYAVLIAVEEGTLRLDEPVGAPGVTVRHLLAHAGGYSFDGPVPIAPPGTRRIYSNTGFEVLGRHLEERSAVPVSEHLRQAVFDPLGMADTSLRGSPAHQGWGTVEDLLRFARELRSPKLIDATTLGEATHVQFPGLRGVLPGVGRQVPMDWGLGFELRSAKRPHWMGERVSPQAFGHFGGSGTYLFVDPEAHVAVACLTAHDFGPWALESWPTLNDAIVEELAS